MALRVVSFPADRKQNEERGHLCRRQPLTVDLGLHQVGGQILVRIGAAVLGQRDAVTADSIATVNLVEIGGDVRIAEPRMTFVQWKTFCAVLVRDAHHVADDLQREWAGNSETKSPDHQGAVRSSP